MRKSKDKHTYITPSSDESSTRIKWTGFPTRRREPHRITTVHARNQESGFLVLHLGFYEKKRLQEMKQDSVISGTVRKLVSFGILLAPNVALPLTKREHYSAVTVKLRTRGMLRHFLAISNSQEQKSSQYFRLIFFFHNKPNEQQVKLPFLSIT